MNRGDRGNFHFAIQSSSYAAVNGMWKLCIGGTKSEQDASFSTDSEANGTDF